MGVPFFTSGCLNDACDNTRFSQAYFDLQQMQLARIGSVEWGATERADALDRIDEFEEAGDQLKRAAQEAVA